MAEPPLSSFDLNHLGYDPHPGQNNWRGTPIPRIDRPLAGSPERFRIAGYVWWNGPPWTVLRNSTHYLWHVMDYGITKDIQFTLRDVPAVLWNRALDQAGQGRVSKGSYVLWSLVFGRMALDEPCKWQDAGHLRDCRPLANDPRQTTYYRHARHHQYRLTGVG